MKTNELTGAALDWAVAKCEGTLHDDGSVSDYFQPSVDWEQGGAIIEREYINIVKNESGKYWQAASEKWMLNDGHPSIGETPLIAAMRCYVESELGDEVEVPEDLIKQCPKPQQSWCMAMNKCENKCEDCPDKPKREWVGLTNLEIDDVQYSVDCRLYRDFARAIEAKLERKNTT